MKTKNLFCLLLTLILCLAAFSACAKKPADETEATAAADDAEETAANDAEETTAAEEETEAPEENEEFVPEADRTTANFAGTYGFERCTIVATAIDENTMEFNVHWGSSAFEAEEWVMTGTHDARQLQRLRTQDRCLRGRRHRYGDRCV